MALQFYLYDDKEKLEGDEGKRIPISGYTRSQIRRVMLGFAEKRTFPGFGWDTKSS